MFQCQYCKKFYSTKSGLKVHQTRTKSCISMRDEFVVLQDFKCEYCYKFFTSSATLKSHIKNCPCKNKHLMIENMKKELIEKCREINEKDEEIYKLQQKNKELSDILKECALKPIIINTTNNNSNNNMSNQIKNEDNRTLNVVTFLKEINKHISTKLLEDNVKHLTIHHCLGGGTGLADYALQYPLSENPIVCTDQSRKAFKYAEDFNGRTLINEDKNLIQFNPRFLSAIKDRSRELLEDFSKTIDISDEDGLAKATEISNIIKDINYSAKGEKTKISDDLVLRIAEKTPFSIILKMLNKHS